MNLGKLSPVAGITTIPSCYPHYGQQVRKQFEHLGVKQCIELVNSHDDSALKFRGRKNAICIQYHEKPPPDYPGPAGAWYQTCAWLDLIGIADCSNCQSILLLEHDAIITKDCKSILDSVVLPEVWDCIYLGADHSYGTTETVGGNLLRINGSLCIHAVLFHRRTFKRILGWKIDNGADNLIAKHLHPEGNCYAVWPQAAIQRPGVSTVTGESANDLAIWESRGIILDSA